MTSNAANFLRSGWSASRSLLRAKLNLLLRRSVLRAQRSLWFFQFLDSPSGQDSGGSDLSESDDSYPSGCECPDSLCDDADSAQGADRWAHRPEPSAVCAQASVFWTCCVLPQNQLIWRKMSRECEGIFLARERRDNKDSSPRCAHEGFCACTSEGLHAFANVAWFEGDPHVHASASCWCHT